MVYRVSSRAMWVALAAVAAGVMGYDGRVHAAASDVVLYASEASVVRGNWAAAASSSAAGGRLMRSNDHGFSSTQAPQASPSNYFELSFDAPAGTTYRVWLRLRAGNNSKWNDAVWVQFSDATTTGGQSLYRIGTTSGLMVNLERCSNCGTSSWGWQNTAYWLQQPTEIRFANSGSHTIRVQTREDGVEVDQIVLSPATYVGRAPGPILNDSTIVAKPSGGSAPSTGGGSLTPFKGSPLALPGTVPAADFDNGGRDVAYRDDSQGNAGSEYRQTDVDLQSASIGGYNVGWTAPGEWLKYSVSVAAAGSYSVGLRVAALAAQSVQVTIGSTSQAFAIPSTGGWQSWTTVSVPMQLAAGQQTLTVKFNTGGVNLHSIGVSQGASAPPPPPAQGGGGSGGTFRMMTWNVHHGKDTSNRLNVPGQAQHIANQKPDVVVLQEVQTWDQDQPKLFESELERLTGVNWFRVWAPVQPSQWTEGNVVLTRLPVISSTTHQMHATGDWSALLSNRSVAQATVSVGGVAVHVFSTHLDYGNTTFRTAQLIDLMVWLTKFRGPSVVGGDFNSTPGTYWIDTMLGDFLDTWRDVTGSFDGGGTIHGVRFDYLFRCRDHSDKIRPTSVKLAPSWLSDHAPVIADYTVIP